MPWHVESNHPDCKGYAVVKEGGKMVGCHPTRAAAHRHMAALYAHEPGAKGYDAPGAGVNEVLMPGPTLGKSAGPLKASLLDDDAFRLLAFPFGGPIPHPAYPGGVDVDGQTFSPRTDIKADWFDTRLVDWFHGADPRFGRAVLGKAVDLGRFEGKSDEPDADGWWVTVWLKRGEERVNLVKRLAERATIYGSSETGPGLASVKAVDGSIHPWRRDIAGEIIAWPYLRQTLAAIAQNTYSIIRPLKATLEDYLSEGEPPAAGFWSDLEAALRDLGTDLRATLGESPGESAAKSGRVLSRLNEGDLRAALEAARAALDRLDAVVKRQPDYEKEAAHE